MSEENTPEQYHEQQDQDHQEEFHYQQNQEEDIQQEDEIQQQQDNENNQLEQRENVERGREGGGNETISKLDIALLAGVATWQTPAPHMNLRWLTHNKKSVKEEEKEEEENNYSKSITSRTIADISTWSAISPSQLDVNGTELVRSPRSALAIFRYGTKVRDLVDSDLPAVHALSRKAKLTKTETAKRIELDRSRRDSLRHDVLSLYESICASFSREEIASAVRRFICKGENNNNNSPSNISVSRSQQQQQLQYHHEEEEEIHENDRQLEQEIIIEEEEPADAFAQLTCAPSREGVNLLREEEIQSIVAKRDVEASRLRKRLTIDAAHRAARIVQELHLTKSNSAEMNTLEQGAERAKVLLAEKQREAAERNEIREMRKQRRLDEIRESNEERIRIREQKNESIDQHVDHVLVEREKHRQNALKKSYNAELERSKMKIPYYQALQRKEQQKILKKQQQKQMLLIQEQEHQESEQQQYQQQEQYAEEERNEFLSPQPQKVNSHQYPKTPNPQQRASSVCSSSNHSFQQQQNQHFSSSSSASYNKKFSASNNNNSYSPATATTTDFEIDDLLTEWRVQNVKLERCKNIFANSKKREETFAQVNENRQNLSRQEQQRKNAANRKEIQRAESAMSNKRHLDSRVSGSFALLRNRIQHAKNFVQESENKKVSRFSVEQTERMQKSKSLLETQAKEQRDKKIEKLFQQDATESWREQRKDRFLYMSDAKKVLFQAELEDIEDDLVRRSTTHRQLSKENHLLRKTEFIARDNLLVEEKQILLDLGLRNFS